MFFWLFVSGKCGYPQKEVLNQKSLNANFPTRDLLKKLNILPLVLLVKEAQTKLI